MLYLFGYGSLINLRSLQNALKRRVNAEDVVQGYLLDYERVWGAAGDIAYENLGVKRSLFLDVKKRNGAYVNGILVSVTDEEIANLDKREKGYERIDVSENVVPATLCQKSTIYTYTYKSIERISDVSCIPYKYWECICNGAGKFGAKFLEDLIKTTEPIDPSKYDIVNEPYTFVDIEQNKYV